MTIIVFVTSETEAVTLKKQYDLSLKHFLLINLGILMTAAGIYLDLHGVVLVAGDDDGVAVALPGLVDGVGKDFKHRMFAAFQIIGAKDNSGALTNPLLTLQHGNTGISVLFRLLFYSHLHLPT